MNSLTNAATITVLSSGRSYHTLNDWGLAIGNNDYIKEPIKETRYVDVPGMSGFLDMSEVISGRPIYKYRMIELRVGAMNPRMAWDSIISRIRSQIDGRVVQIVFDNDIGYFWKGRVAIKNFDRVRELGTFTIEIKAEPYRYNVVSSIEPWLWDSFDFEMGAITYIGTIRVGNSRVVIPSGAMLVAPIFDVESITSETLTVTADGTTYPLHVGRNRFPQLLVSGDDEVILQFNGRGILSIDYRGGSL